MCLVFFLAGENDDWRLCTLEELTDDSACCQDDGQGGQQLLSWNNGWPWGGNTDTDTETEEEEEVCFFSFFFDFRVRNAMSGLFPDMTAFFTRLFFVPLPETFFVSSTSSLTKRKEFK